MLIGLAVVAHLAYGAVAGAVLTVLVERVAVWQALVFAAGLWVVMGVVWLPVLGWGPFGIGLNPRIAVATLALHLIYGFTLGMALTGRGRRSERRERQELAR